MGVDLWSLVFSVENWLEWVGVAVAPFEEEYGGIDENVSESMNWCSESEIRFCALLTPQAQGLREILSGRCVSAAQNTLDQWPC